MINNSLQHKAIFPNMNNYFGKKIARFITSLIIVCKKRQSAGKRLIMVFEKDHHLSLDFFGGLIDQL